MTKRPRVTFSAVRPDDLPDLDTLGEALAEIRQPDLPWTRRLMDWTDPAWVAKSQWTESAWLAEAQGWIGEQVERRGFELMGAIEQPHVRPWATAMRVPTTGGVAWFKASIPVLAHEGAVVELLSGRRPDVVQELWARDPERGWMLTAHGGDRLREVVERERSLDRWLEILPRYAQLQLDAAPDADRFVAAGVPDRRLSLLPAQYERLLQRAAQLGLVERVEHARLRALVEPVAERCEALARLGVPETIQHDDLHDGQIFVRDGACLFFDWGDSCVSHPFFSMSVTLEGSLAWGLDDAEGSLDTTPFRDAYLAAFADRASDDELVTALELALPLGWICRSLNVERYASPLDQPERDYLLSGVGTRLRLALAGVDEAGR
jgi:hypothetical protein